MPSTSKKQQRFMGMNLAKQRKTGSNDTGMGETQLAEFAGSRRTKAVKEKPGRSLIDVEIVKRKPETGSLKLSGFLYVPGQKGHEAQKSHEFLASWESREIKSYSDYKADVCFHGPDTEYRAEEINPHHYGRDYEPYPLRDYYKDQKKDDRDNLRLTNEYDYSELKTPGTVPDDPIESSQAYGAIGYKTIDRDLKDNRSFERQRVYRRSQAELEADKPTIRDLDEY